MMVTQEEYEKAKKQLDEAKKLIKEASVVINSFEQMELEVKRERLRRLKKNDFVEYIGGTKSKYLTIGNKYRLTGDSFGIRISIINDAGKRVVIKPIKFFKF
jgi:hypothetical protein